MQNAQISGLKAKENNYTSVCVCYVQYSFTPTHFNVTKSESSQRIRQNKFKNRNPHGICNQFDYSISRKAKSQK